MSRWSILTTLFLGKVYQGSFPEFSAHSFASNQQLALLESAKEGNYFLRTNVPNAMVHFEAAQLRSGHATGVHLVLRGFDSPGAQ